MFFEQIEIYSLGNIIDARVVPNLNIIEELVQEKRAIDIKLKENSMNLLGKPQKFYLDKKLVIDQKISLEKEKLVEQNAGYGFVLCKHPLIAQLIISSFEGKESMGIGMDKWRLSEAPYEADLLWRNPPEDNLASMLKRWVLNFLFILLFLILLTPLTMVGIIADLLEEFELPIETTSFVTYSLPSITISLFHSIIIPLAIRFLTDLEKNSLHSRAFTNAFILYIGYSIGIMVFFPLLEAVTLKSVFTKLAEIDISKWSITLVSNIVMVGEFFVNFVISMAIGSNFLDLAITNEYFTFNYYRYRRSYIEKTAPVFDFTYEYSRVVCICSIVLVFSIATPLILPFGCLYLAIKYSFDKYSLLYVYRVEQMPGTNMQGLVLSAVLFILGISQMINSGIFLAGSSNFLVCFGAFYCSIGFATCIASYLILKYWSNYNEASTFELTCKDLYMHPYLSVLNS